MGTKRLLLCLLAAAAVGMFAPSAASAATNVAKIGDIEYSTISAAIAAANSGDVIVLIDNVAESIEIAAGKTITLDLNGFTLTNKDNNDTITNKGTLFVIDSSTAKTGTVDNVNHGHGALVNYPDATATLSGGTFVRSKETGSSGTPKNSWYVIKNLGTLTINDGTTVKEESNYSSLIDNGWYNASNPGTSDRKQSSTGKTATLIINGGNFTGGLNTIKNDDLGDLTINGGTFEDHCQAIIQNNNVATINGGTFDGSHLDEDHSTDHDHALIENKPSDDSTDKGVLTITGGTFIAGDSEVNVITYVKSNSSLSADQVVITGGSFTVGNSTLFNNTGSESPTIDTYGGTYDVPVPAQYLADGLANITSDGGTFTLESSADVENVAMASMDVGGTTVYFSTREAANTYTTKNPGSGGMVAYTRAFVTFMPSLGGQAWTEIVPVGETVPIPADPTLDGYIFVGYYADSAYTRLYNFSQAVTADITIYAYYITDAVIKVYRNVQIPAVDGITTNPGAGVHYVAGHDDFAFTASFADGEPRKVFATGYYSDNTIELEPKDLGGGTYEYVLRQVVEPWTIAFGSVASIGETGTEAIAGASRVWTYGNTLHISVSGETKVDIYAITGALIKTMRLSAGETLETLERGIYIVKADDKASKVVIR